MFEFEGRRLTGPNFFALHPLAIIDAEIPGNQVDSIVKAWLETVKVLYTKLGRAVPKTGYRIHEKGQSLYFSAAIDALYSAIDLGEFALEVAAGERHIDDLLSTDSEQEVIPMVDYLASLFEDEARPELIVLQNRAEEEKVPFLWCDDFVSLGFGRYAQTWEREHLPDLNDLDWSIFKRIPVAFITGTNGKSTTTRLCSQILKGAGHTVGFSSTDGIWAGDDCLDAGDYSGPGGAREVLRNTRVTTAILEVARGGLLRRGLGATGADVALITNVAEDHLGEYGVNTLDELVEAKFIVRKSLSPVGKLVLNADDIGCRNYAANLEHDIIWFALDKTNPTLKAHLKCGEPAFFVEDGKIQFADGEGQTLLCSVDEVPITFSGAARHNIANALAASAVCYQLGVTPELIRLGLKSFESNRENNPGRGNLIKAGKVSIMVDFAHNPHGLNAVVDTLLQLPAKRRLVMMGHAGDRSNKDIQALTKVALRLLPERIVLFELEEYLRGRALGEISEIMFSTLISEGVDKRCISLASSPGTGAKDALDWAKDGDFLLLLALGDRERVFDEIDNWGQSNNRANKDTSI